MRCLQGNNQINVVKKIIFSGKCSGNKACFSRKYNTYIYTSVNVAGYIQPLVLVIWRGGFGFFLSHKDAKAL